MAAKSLGMLLEVKGLSPCPRPAELEGGTGGEEDRATDAASLARG